MKPKLEALQVHYIVCDFWFLSFKTKAPIITSKLSEDCFQFFDLDLNHYLYSNPEKNIGRLNAKRKTLEVFGLLNKVH